MNVLCARGKAITVPWPFFADVKAIFAGCYVYPQPAGANSVQFFSSNCQKDIHQLNVAGPSFVC
jgi:hypothetical protein